MALIEREGLLASLQQHFEAISNGEGHCIFISGEAGIGKTSLVKAFCKKQSRECSIYQGACDALFTPRPLAPLYDILWQVNKERWPTSPSSEERSALFADFFQELSTKEGKILIVFEDIHWADEGTLDFIRFFARRINQLPCLFILTYRDDEIHTRHPLRNVLGQLPPDSFTKKFVTPLSKTAVVEMAMQKGYSGEDVYSISGGNPFYVNEILASYSPGVPDNIKDSILSVYERQKEGTKNAWQIWSVMPEGLEVERVAKLKSALGKAIDHCFAISVIIVQNDKVVFKHELYRRTIEESLTLFKRLELNKMMLDIFLDSFEEKNEIERILHYAKNANEKKLVVEYAEKAAQKAALIGAHLEASKLYLTAIEYFEENTSNQLEKFFKAYAYECYLSNQIQDAISFTEKVLHKAKENADTKEISDSLLFLSRLWWFNGSRKNAESYAEQAIELLKEEPACITKAMGISNMSHLKMQSYEYTECILWGNKAVEMAKELKSEEVICDAFNSVGVAYMLIDSSSEHKGVAMLQQSLKASLQFGYHEHAAVAYLNLAISFIKLKKYAFAAKILNDGLHHCEECDLSFWSSYTLSLKARLKLETGQWNEAHSIAVDLLKNENQPAVIKITALIVIGKITMRRGENDALTYLQEAKKISFETMELRRIIPSMIALLEYEWLIGKTIIEEDDIEKTTALLRHLVIDTDRNEFAFWMKKARTSSVVNKQMVEAYDSSSIAKTLKAASFWEEKGCGYEQALLLFEGEDDNKRKAISIMQDLEANAVNEKMKQEMKNAGIKNIPRGLRKSTRSNTAYLTDREMDVLRLLKAGLQNKEIAAQLYISAKTVDHHISSILFKLDVNSRSKAVTEALRAGIIK